MGSVNQLRKGAIKDMSRLLRPHRWGTFILCVFMEGSLEENVLELSVTVDQ